MTVPQLNFNSWLDACEKQHRDAVEGDFHEAARGIRFAVKQFFTSNGAVSSAPLWCL